MNRMKTTTRKTAYILVLLTLTALLSCGNKESAATVERTVAIKAMVVRATDREMTYTYTGSLEGEKQAIVYAKLSESVDRILVKEGQRVDTEQVLISLDKTGPSAGYNSARSVFLNAEKNFKKMESLFKEGAISESQFDGARTEYEVSKSNFDAVERLVDLRTPIAGLVTAVKVSPGDFVTAGQQLATVATTDRLRIKFGINPEDIGFVGKGAGVSVSSDVVAESAAGTVLSVAASADPITRTFQVEALIDNDKGLFKPGMFVNVLITRQKLTNIIAIPREAVLTLDNRQVVYVVVNGVAHKQPVTLGADLDGVVVAASGLAVGDTVVTLGQNYLDEGFKVNVTALNEGTK